MVDLELPNDTTVIDLEDDRPIALRRKRRSSSGASMNRKIQSLPKSSARNMGINTPPATPQRTKKRVRFSDSGSELTTGLTPFIRRTSLASSPPPSTPRRHSSPLGRWSPSTDSSPFSGTLQFAPLRQVLEGRVKRRIRRNRLSEEVNIIEVEKRQERKSRATEIERLREELRRKDEEMAYMREEHEIACQIGEESGLQPTEVNSARIRDLERQIIELKAELQLSETSMHEDNADWTMAAQDPYNDDDTFLQNMDNDFNGDMTDIVFSTPGRAQRSFPSPPSTMPNTPSKPHSAVDATTQALDINKQHLETQLKSLQEDLQTLSRKLEATNTTQERLATKLSSYIVSESDCSDATNFETLDTALDTVLTELTVSKSFAQESSARFTALATELNTLFPSASLSDPEAIVAFLHAEFRRARLDLEYLLPGETTAGFDPSKLLDMLISRLRVLIKKVEKQDSDIDQYHEQEVSLRQQLSARVDVTTQLRSELEKTQVKVYDLEKELGDKDLGIEKLTAALQTYRDEVSSLESLITKLESEHNASTTSLRSDHEKSLAEVRQETESALLTAHLEKDTLAAQKEGSDMLLIEIEKRLATALQTSQTLESQLAIIQTERDSALASIKTINSTHGAALALRDARVSELRDEVERVNTALREAHISILNLKRDKRALEGQVEGEQKRGKLVIDAMRAQLARAIETGLGYLDGAVSTSSGVLPSSPATDVVALQGERMAVGVSGNTAVVIPGPKMRLLDAGHARKSGGGGKKRRRYDSGMGFLEEDEEGDVIAP